VASGRRIRRSIGEQDRTRSRTDKPWRERPCDFARGQGARASGGVAHAMVCAVSGSQTAFAGGTPRRPFQVPQADASSRVTSSYRALCVRQRSRIDDFPLARDVVEAEDDLRQ